MAAGQGFKTFNTGDVLTAADVNGYLMQGVLVFASAAARNAAITSPQEGQYCYLKDTNVTYYYDGSTWVVSGATGDITSVNVTSPITGGGASGDVTIGIDSSAIVPSQTGNSGKYLTTNGTSSSWASVAGGALNWTPRYIGANVAIYTVAYNGSNLYVAAGNSGNLYTSPDLVTWTQRTSGFGSNVINKVIYANSLWVAVGANGTITTSSDGITWTARTANMSTNSIMDIHYANSTFVAVGAGGGATNTGGIIYSTDGITWTRKSQTPTIGTTYVSVIYNGTNWLVGATFSTNNYLYATTPSGTWTAANTGNGNLYGLYYDGSKTYSFYDSSTYIYVTADTILTNETVYSITLTASGSGNQSGSNAQKNQIAITTSNIYFTGYYFQSSSTAYVGSSIQTPQTWTPLSVAPTTLGINTTPYISLSSNYGIMATSLGVISWSSNGRIWTTY